MARSEAASPVDCCRAPCFFKVFLPKLSSESLTIPPAFRHHMRDESRGVVSLRGPSGRIWCVDLVEDSKGLSFHKGWKDFVADHSIELGDFLVFRQDHGFHFTVLLFDATACEKKCAFFARPHFEDIAIVEARDGMVSSGEVAVEALDETFHVDPTRKKRKRESGCCPHCQNGCNNLLPTKLHQKKFPPSNKITTKRSRLHSDCGSITKSKSNLCSGHACRSTKLGSLASHGKSTTLAKRRGRPPLLSSWNDARKSTTQIKQVSKINFPTGTSLPRSTSKNSKENGKAIEWRSKTMIPPHCLSWIGPIQLKRLREAMVEVLRLGSLLSQRRTVTEQEVDKALEMAKSFKSENPFTIIVMRHAYVYTSFFVHIPRPFSDELDPNEKVTLWDPNGKPWPVIYSIIRRSGRFGGGWGKFSCALNLEVDDACVFELIGKNQLKVHIFRVVEELTTLIRVRRKSSVV